MNGSEMVENCLLAIWVWIIIVLVVLSISGVFQTLKTLFWCYGPRSYKITFLQKRIPGIENNKNAESVDRFAREFLKPDVMFLLSMIEEKGSVLGTREALKCSLEEFDKVYNEQSDIELTVKC